MGILNEAVKELELLDDDTSFDLSDEEALDKLDKFLNDEEEVDDRFEMIVDVDAESEDELKDSYLNDLLLYCPVCHQIHFATEGDITADEENPEIVNVGEECPHCKQVDGFEIKGKVAAYQPTDEEETTEEETEESTEEETEVDEDDIIDEQFSRFVNGDYSRKVSDYTKKGKINELVAEDTPTRLDESFDSWKSATKKQKRNSVKESVSIKAKDKRHAICEKFGVKNFDELKERFQGKGTKEEKENFVKVLESFGFKNVKFGKPLTEDNEKPLTKSPYKNIIGKQFDYTFDFDFLDIVADIIDRIDFEDYKEAEDKFDFVYEELDSSLTSINDQWQVLQWYVPAPADLDSSSWTEALDSFTNELVEICDKIVVGNVEEKLTESFNKSLHETWKGDDKIADLAEWADSMYTDGNYGDMEDCVTQALDNGLMKSADVWDLAEHYGVINNDELIDRFYEDLWNDVYSEVYNNHKFDQDEEDDEDEEETPTEESLKERLTPKNEGYTLLGAEDKNIEAYSNYYTAKKRAEELGLKEAEYGDVYGSNVAYCFWNKSGDRNDDEEIMCYYFFGEDGKPKHEVTSTELSQIAKAFGLSEEDIDDAEKAIKESCENESVSKRDDIDADADDKKEKAKAEDEKAIDDADADRDDKLNESQSQEIGSYYDKLSEINGFDLNELVYGEDGFMANCYPEGFPDFAGDVIYSEKYWNEFMDWAKNKKGIEIKTVEDKYADLEECDESLEELDESVFDKLVNKYCNRVYENIDSYKTTSGSIENNQIVLEGVITFKSGKTSPTKFIFESIKDEKGTRLIGLNETFSKGKKAFKLKGAVENKQFIAESLTYNYRTKVNEETKTIYGRVINNKK